MNTYTQSNPEIAKLSMPSRIIRLALGTVLLAIPLAHSGMLDVLAVLPLLAIYPILTGILGYGLLELLVANQRSIERPPHLVITARASLLVLGSGLIAFVMASATAPAWLALFAIVPILMAVLDVELLGEVLATRRALQTKWGAANTAIPAQLFSMPTRSASSEEHHPKQAA